MRIDNGLCNNCGGKLIVKRFINSVYKVEETKCNKCGNCSHSESLATMDELLILLSISPQSGLTDFVV